MSKEQKVFTKEFKLEAVQFVQKSGKSQAQIAWDLGIANSTLHHWCKKFAKAGEQAFPGSGNSPTSEEELRRLRREVEDLRQECDILKRGMLLRSATADELFLQLELRGVQSEMPLVMTQLSNGLMMTAKEGPGHDISLPDTFFWKRLAKGTKIPLRKVKSELLVQLLLHSGGWKGL